MSDLDFYYVALDEDGEPTDVVLHQDNHAFLMKDAPEGWADKVWATILPNVPELKPNQRAERNGWSAKTDENDVRIFSWDWEIETWDKEQCLEMWVRGPRNYLLASTDWTVLTDNQLTTATKNKWKTYRQELRDLTTVYADVEDPDDIVWPKAPGEPDYVDPPSDEDEGDSE
tara:strand:- start:12849 stop:13364 length:516 start_codon:yes stop_codon:yes gene_type:complete